MVNIYFIVPAWLVMSRAVLFSGHLISTSSSFSNFVACIEKTIAAAQNFIIQMTAFCALYGTIIKIRNEINYYVDKIKLDSCDMISFYCKLASFLRSC